MDSGLIGGTESLAELGLIGNPNEVHAPRWSRVAFALGVMVVIALAVFAVLVVIPTIVRLIAELIIVLPAGVG